MNTDISQNSKAVF